MILDQLVIAPAARQTTLAQLLSSSALGSERLLDAIEQGRASRDLLRDSLIRQGIGETNPRLDELLKNLPDPSEEIAMLLVERGRGYSEANPSFRGGKSVFQTHCTVCHSIDGEGGKLGPNLDWVHVRGTDRLLEDILDPNRNVDPAFSLTTIRTQSGQNISGIGARSEGEAIILTDAAGTMHRILEKEVLEKTHSQLSLMPAALGGIIPENDLYDLLEFLLINRAGKQKDEPSVSHRKFSKRGSNRRPR